MGTSTGGVSETAFPRTEQEHEHTSFEQLTKYDVFLNHRGPDLKKTFVSHLNKALRLAGCEPFLDAEALVKGQHAFNSINEALSGVVVHVAIFSRRYAESKYCLNELCDMLASGKPVIPVFYDVEPENLRRTDEGPFAEAFGKHLRKGRDADVVRWRAGLVDAAAITGFKLTECDNDTVKLEEEVVAAVLDAIPCLAPLASARHHVGLEERSKRVMDMLQKMGEKVGVVGICGMGGIGKTTLAREVYKREQSRFGSWCYLSDVKEAKGVAVMDLQMKMVTDLVQVDAKKLKWDCDRWFDRIRKLRNKVLVVIDDINKRQQFDELVPDLKELPGGSRVLITSRESGVLRSIMSNVENELYEVPELEFDESLDLFVWCAFQRREMNLVDDVYHGFARDITKACCGLPLALEVMGGFLSDKKNLPDDERYWRGATLALQRNGDIMTSLRMSYESLVEEEKRMFLEIACVMIGHPKRIGIEVWDSNGFGGSARWSLSKLVDKCLVKMKGNDGDSEYRYEEDVIIMHDLLRDMGRNIVMEMAPFKLEMRRYIWYNLEALKVLEKKQGSNEVLALSLSQEKIGIACNAEAYARMRELRYLFLDDCLVNGDFSDWSKELRWLKWRHFPHEELPPSLVVPNLTVLDLGNSDCLIHIWDVKKFKSEIPCRELQMLILSGCRELRELPEDINKLVRLNLVNLEGCTSLQSLPDSLGDLTELDYLSLGECTSLNSLPDSLGDLTKLEYLNLYGCKLIEYLPESVVKLVKLRDLCVSNCGLRKLPMEFGRLKSLAKFEAWDIELEELPESFGLLDNLKHVELEWCRGLQNLSENFGCLGNLKNLNLGWCRMLTKLPQSFSDLSNLVELELVGCKLLNALPASIHGLKKLRIFRMGHTAINGLPKGFGQLQSLTVVSLRECKQLETLCEDFVCLKNLQSLDLNGCASLSSLPESFSNLSHLKVLHLYSCKLLQKLPCSIYKLKKLRELDMSETTLEELPVQFGQLQSLTRVDFSDCKQLRSLCENFGWLENLQILKLGGCKSFTKLPESFSNLSKLVDLDVSHCKLDEKTLLLVFTLKNLQSLQMRCMTFDELPNNLVQLQSLRKLDLSDCKQLQCLCEDFGSLETLQNLSLENCENLTELPDSFSTLSNLEELCMNGCRQEERLPLVYKLKKLRVLKLMHSVLKVLLEDFGQMQSLTRADFGDCTELQLLCDNFGDLGSLQWLSLKNCSNLIQLPLSFSNLSNLEELYMNGCRQVKRLPCVYRLKKLRVLEMSNMALEILPEDFGQMPSLTRADFGDCTELQLLCDNFGDLGSLQRLSLKNCSNLIQLPLSFSNLSNLRELYMNGCRQVKRLPCVYRLKKLRVLEMSNMALEILPEDFGQMPSLTRADFGDCTELQLLCDNFGNLGSLQRLSLKNCSNLIQLPLSFSNLSNLEELYMNGCRQVKRLPCVYRLKKLRVLEMTNMALEILPEDFGQMQSLTRADFGDCTKLQLLCDNFGDLGSLGWLSSKNCSNLIRLPLSFSNLSNLKELYMNGCRQVKRLPCVYGLKKLRVLKMTNMALEILPEDFGQMQSLRRAGFRDCTELQLLCDNFGDLGSLKWLSLKNCSNLIQLPLSFSNLCRLEKLDLSGCTLLNKLPMRFSSLKQLKELNMSDTALEALPEDFGQLQCLTQILLRNCNHLETLCEDFGCLGQLEKLDLIGCESLIKLPDSFSNLSNLCSLDLSWCKVLQSLHPISQLKKVRRLCVGSTALEELPEDFGNLQNLETIDFNDSKQMYTLCENFGHLRRLRTLNLMFCEGLRKLPDSFSNLSELEELRLYGCKVLQELPPSIRGLKALRVLHMGNTALEELPEDFGELQSLREVDFRSCKQLQNLDENFGNLESLEKLNLDGCESLTELPISLSKLSKLKELSLYRCKQIQKLPRSIWRLKHLSVTPEAYKTDI